MSKQYDMQLAANKALVARVAELEAALRDIANDRGLAGSIARAALAQTLD